MFSEGGEKGALRTSGLTETHNSCISVTPKYQALHESRFHEKLKIYWPQTHLTDHCKFNLSKNIQFDKDIQLCNWNGIWAHNQLVCKQTLNHLAKFDYQTIWEKGKVCVSLKDTAD